MNKETLPISDQNLEILIKTFDRATGFLACAETHPSLPHFDSEGTLLFTSDDSTINKIVRGIAFGCYRELRAKGLKSVAQGIIDKNKT